MAISTTGNSNYYCHLCETEIIPNLEDYTCPTCHMGFIEVINRSPVPTNDSREVNVSQFMQQMLNGSLSDGLLRRQPFADFVTSEDIDGVSSSSRERTTGSDRPFVSTRIHLTSLGNQFGISLGEDDGLHNLNRVIFERFITSMMNEFQSGPPPATESAINELPVLTLTKETAAKYAICSICYDDFVESQTVVTLPCAHTYHQNCVTTWLKHHGTCPVCRKDLAGHDTSRFEDTSGFPGQDDGPSSNA